MKSMTPHRISRVFSVPAAILTSVAGTTTVGAQLDPLIGLKHVPPNVVLILDTSFRMLDDGLGNYYDAKTYRRADDPPVADALGVSDSEYRRVYHSLGFEAAETPDTKYVTERITAVPSSDRAFASFCAGTRFEIARLGIAQAVDENPTLVRWGLLKLRQSNPQWRDPASSTGCDRPVRTTASPGLTAAYDMAPCPATVTPQSNRFVLYAPFTELPNFSLPAGSGGAIVHGLGSTGATAEILATLARPMGTGPLVPAGKDTAEYADRPLDLALTDARAHLSSAMASDPLRTCRNTVVILLAGGRDDGDGVYRDWHDAAATAASFRAVSAGGATRRVPIVTIGLKPTVDAETELTAIAGVSGGRYFRADSAADVARAVNFAVQLGFAKASDFDAGRPSEFINARPVIGTVDLTGASGVGGVDLPNAAITATTGPMIGQPIVQRANVLLTAGYSLPSFDGRVRAFRAYRPIQDETAPMGWRFVADGTRLWPDLDGRPELAGQARTPSPASRNIYTFIPNGAGGGAVVPFTLARAADLAPHLGTADPATVIRFVREQPLGAVIGSTPAIVDPPSLDPPPDSAYGTSDTPGTFAAVHRKRRSVIYFGANDGMVHAVDARTGYEVWAFIPYNLLPKLRTLLDGQPVERFEYFVDSPPKVAELKLGGVWKTILVIGQSYGGTFYQAFDVTTAGLGVDPALDGPGAVSSMLATFDEPDEGIRFKWAFPNYSSFDPETSLTALTADGFPGGRISLYGDLKSTATAVEKRVGFTFSNPAAGPLVPDRRVNAVIAGSGYFPPIESLLPQRGGVAAGHALFVLDAETGRPLGDPGGTSCAGTGCVDLGDAGNGRKNALQADIAVTGDIGSPAVTTAYAGDLDGRYWRFVIQPSGAISEETLIDSGQPIYSASAVLHVGTSSRYLFVATGSDRLSATTPGGGSSGGTAFRLFGLKDRPVGGSLVTFTRSLSPVVSGGAATNGERPAAAPAIAGDVVFFTTTMGPDAMSCRDSSAQVYGFTYLGTPAYDTNGNDQIDPADSVQLSTSPGQAAAPVVADRHLYVALTSLAQTGVVLFGDPANFGYGLMQAGLRILSWREIR